MLPHGLFLSFLPVVVFLFQGLSGTCQLMHPSPQFKDQQYRVAYRELLVYADIALRTEHHKLRDFNVQGFYVNPDAHRNNSKRLQTDAFHAYAWTFPTLM